MDFAGADMGSERRQSSCAALRAGLSAILAIRRLQSNIRGEITSEHISDRVYLVMRSIMAQKSS